MSKTYYVYILASQRNGTLYIGVTNDLARRCREHREGVVAGFTKNYGLKTLVYYEIFQDIHAAIHRESRMKKYKRKWKLNLIESSNSTGRIWRRHFESMSVSSGWPAFAVHDK